MAEIIKKTFLIIKIAFVLLWAVAIALVIIGEMSDNWVGSLSDNAPATFYLETLCILLATICVPIALKLYAWVLAKRIDRQTLVPSLKSYQLWSIIRLSLLAVPVIAGLLTYYLTLSSTGALCAAISLTASLFCIPTDRQMSRELHIETIDN